MSIFQNERVRGALIPLSLIIIGGSIGASWVLANLYGVEPQQVKATIIAKYERFDIKHGTRCEVFFSTELGRTSAIFSGKCDRDSGFIKQDLVLDVKKERLTGNLGVMYPIYFNKQN